MSTNTINKVKKYLIHWDKIFTTCTADKGLIFLIYKELSKTQGQMIENPIEKWEKDEKKINIKKL